MPNAVHYSNTAQPTTLSGSINSGATAMTVGATTGFPGSFPYVLAVDYGAATEELVLVTNASGPTLTVTRGYGGTSAQSHSTGAVVTHVYNAQDATDFRTHEAGATGVHGVTGSIVDTASTQTLAGKTLTTPTINSGGALNGTFTGSPTLSGAVTLSGGGSLSGTFAGSPDLSGNPAFSGTPVFSGSPTLASFANAQHSHASAAGGGPLSCIEVNTTGPALSNLDINTVTSQTSSPLRLRDPADAVTLFNLHPAGGVRVQPVDPATRLIDMNAAAGQSTDLVRVQVNGSDRFTVDSAGLLAAYGGNAFTTYVPVVTGGGSVTWDTRTGYWTRVGKMVFVNIYLVVTNAGSGSSTLTVTTPTTPDRSLRQMLPMTIENAVDPLMLGTGAMVLFTGGSGAAWDRLRATNNGATNRDSNLTGADLLAGAIVNVQGWYREA